MPPMDRRPPLAVSPRRLRPRRTLRAVPSDQTPPASAKTKTPVRSSLPCDRFLGLQRPIISSGPIKMANEDFEEEENAAGLRGGAVGGGTPAIKNSSFSPLFERGRFYELYSARRNERLKRKQTEVMMMMMMDEDVVAHDPSVAVELAKKRCAKKAESVRKSVPANFSVSRTSSLRSSVRSSMEMKKAGSAVGGSYQKPTAGNRIGTRRI